MAESAQFTVLMDDALALELGLFLVDAARHVDAERAEPGQQGSLEGVFFGHGADIADFARVRNCHKTT